MNAVVWISREAKRLQRKHKSLSWDQARTRATANYHKRSKKKSRPAKKRQVKKKAKPRKKRIHGPGSGVSTNSKSHTDYNRNKVNITVGDVNAHMRSAKEKLLHLIGKEEARKFSARTKSIRNKIQKKITQFKTQYRRLMC